MAKKYRVIREDAILTRPSGRFKHLHWEGRLVEAEEDESALDQVTVSAVVGDARLYVIVLRDGLEESPDDDNVLRCPSCGNSDPAKMRYLEDIVSHRDVCSAEDGLVVIEGLYESGEGYDDGDNGRLECRETLGEDMCLTEFPIPDDWETDFV